MISAWYLAFLSLQEVQTSVVAYLVCCHIFGLSTVQGLSCNMALQVYVQRDLAQWFLLLRSPELPNFV